MVHFDMALVNEVSAHTWSNVAYGGASLEESIDEFYYLYEQNPNIQRVVLGLSFYTVNSNYQTSNRMKTLKTQLENPAAYVLNLEYTLNTLTNFYNVISHQPDVLETAKHTAADYKQAGQPLLFRKDLIAYAATLYGNCAKAGVLPSAVSAADGTLVNAREMQEAMLARTSEDSKFSVNEAALAKLLKMADFCAEKGIELTFVFPPMDQSVRTLVCEPLGIDTAMVSVLEALKASGARVLDYEWTDVPDYPDTAFYDGFHIDVVHGMPQYTRELFGEVG